MAWRGRQAPDLGAVPPEEGISEADATERIGLDPQEQPNQGERGGRAVEGIASWQHPEDS